MEERPQTRYPLVGEELTDFRGIVYTPVFVRHRQELADGTIDFEELAAPPMTLSPTWTSATRSTSFRPRIRNLRW